MKTVDIFEEISIALLANKARSSLTILGIVIGIGSVIAMVAMGQGAQGSIKSNIESLGSNLIQIMPGQQSGPGYQVSQGQGSAKTLTMGDVDAIRNEVGSVKAVAPATSSRYQITAKGTNTNTSVIGTTIDYAAIKNIEIDDGSFITEQNVKSISKVAVLGPTTRDDLFGENAENVVGQEIRINKIIFKVVGVAKEKGGSGMNNQDDVIYIPLSTAQQFFIGGDYVNSINVQAESEEVMITVQEDITNLLLSRHGITDSTLADFRIMNQTDILESASSITETLTMLLAAIAGISLVVGGIGIMNMMLTTVTERTREIGLRKAIGAKRKDINIQFLTEAIMLTFIGGVIGVIIGWLAALVANKFGGIATEISLISVVLAFGVSAIIGIVFGYYPARRASKLNPIEALRYE
ncbi:MAG: ABC transporter permease [Patescibacteria group bacterium]|jgi:putative ABC transport system permease protein